MENLTAEQARAREAAKANEPGVVLVRDADREWGTNLWGVPFGERGLPWAAFKEYGVGPASTLLDR
eukprot:3840482-Lingulodinium_polyedra.AAC.1